MKTSSSQYMRSVSLKIWLKIKNMLEKTGRNTFDMDIKCSGKVITVTNNPLKQVFPKLRESIHYTKADSVS